MCERERCQAWLGVGEWSDASPAAEYLRAEFHLPTPGQGGWCVACVGCDRGSGSRQVGWDVSVRTRPLNPRSKPTFTSLRIGIDSASFSGAGPRGRNS